jgi:hypothetical protein
MPLTVDIKFIDEHNYKFGRQMLWIDFNDLDDDGDEELYCA